MSRQRRAQYHMVPAQFEICTVCGSCRQLAVTCHRSIVKGKKRLPTGHLSCESNTASAYVLVYFLYLL